MPSLQLAFVAWVVGQLTVELAATHLAGYFVVVLTFVLVIVPCQH
jgi:hypothetical protein